MFNPRDMVSWNTFRNEPCYGIAWKTDGYSPDRTLVICLDGVFVGWTFSVETYQLTKALPRLSQ